MAIEKIVCYSQRKGHAMASAATWEAMMQVRRRAGVWLRSWGGERNREELQVRIFCE